MTLLTTNFTLEEALRLPRWNCLADDMNDTIMFNINHQASKMECVRKICYHKPIIVHSWYRPLKYNLEIGGSFFSAHMFGLATDFSVEGMTCDDVRNLLYPHLRALGMRMELNPGSDWVHLDSFPVCPSRTFKAR